MKSSLRAQADDARHCALSIIITVVHGQETVRRCLRALTPQLKNIEGEIIVPYDRWSAGIGELAAEFPGVRFHRYENLENASDPSLPGHAHRLYDRRRAVGLTISRGAVVAITEDLAIPAHDWVEQILTVHQMPYEVIGGAINNGIDRVLNWALYYCDFGRYGSPLKAGEAEYASDVNISYKRRALESTKEVWRVSYRETLVHWAMRKRRQKIYLDGRMVVTQHRPPLKLWRAFRERVEWGRMFAETRVLSIGPAWRFVYGAGAFLLPPLLLARIWRHMVRQGHSVWFCCRIFPAVLFLLVGWAGGELTAYFSGVPGVVKRSDLANREVSHV